MGTQHPDPSSAGLHEAALPSFLQTFTSHGFLWLDADGLIRDCNLGVERLFGYEKRELIGKSADMFFVPADVANGEPAHEMATAKEKGTAADDRWHIRKDRTVFWAIGILEPIQDDQGRPIGFFKVIRDMTREKLEFEELRRSNKDLQDYAHVAAHDMQAPLNKVIAFGDLLSKELGSALNARASSYLERIKDAAMHLAEMLSSVLKFAKATASPERPEPVNLTEVLNDVKLELELVSAKRQATIESAPLPTVTAHAIQMHQVFANLVSNAIKYGGDKPHVSVQATENEDFHIIDVQDEGPGIAPEDRTRIFDLFYRSRVTGKAAAGMGVGLSIVRKIIQQHGGKIWIEPREPRGTSFRFTLPKRVKKSDTRSGPDAFDSIRGSGTL